MGHTFGDVRSMLQREPSEGAWVEIRDALTALYERGESLDEAESSYCVDVLSRWPVGIERAPSARWAERWGEGAWHELVELCGNTLGSFYLYGRSAGSGSNQWVWALWSTDLGSLREEIVAFFDGFERAPDDLDMDTDALWQDGHRLVVFWQGRPVEDVDMNAHVVWERFFELSDVRSDVEESGDHEMWVGRERGGGGDRVRRAPRPRLRRVPGRSARAHRPEGLRGARPARRPAHRAHRHLRAPGGPRGGARWLHLLRPGRLGAGGGRDVVDLRGRRLGFGGLEWAPRCVL